MTFERRDEHYDGRPDSAGPSISPAQTSIPDSLPSTLPRQEALAHCSLLDESDLRILLVEAQAGQGKTVLVRQFEERSGCPFVWLACSEADADPRIFGERLVEVLDKSFGEFPGDRILSTMRQQLLPGIYADTAAHSISHGLSALKTSLTLVIDDAHLLGLGEESKRLLQDLTEITSERVRFIIISRFQLLREEAPLFPPENCLRIDASLLAFRREEIAMLYNELLRIPTDSKKVNRLLDATEGWITGLLLLQTARDIQRLVDAEEMDTLETFFNDLVSSGLPEEARREISLFSLPESLPEKMLAELASAPTRDWLHEMSGRNLFVRTETGPDGRVFRFHHLFQESLRRTVGREFAPDIRRKFLCDVGRWYMQEQRINEGIESLVRAEAWELVSDALKEHCFRLWMYNHHSILLHMLSPVPEPVQEEYPWLLLGIGIATMGTSPFECPPFLERARELFHRAGDKAGELGAACCLIRFNFGYCGKLARKGNVIGRAQELFKEIRKELPNFQAIFCTQVNADIKTYVECDLDGAVELLADTKRILPPGNTGLFLEVEFSEALLMCLRGDQEKVYDALESCFPLRKAPWISPVYRFSTLIMWLNAQQMIGDHVGYPIQREEQLREWGQLVQLTSQGAFITIWDIDLLLQQGKYDEALALTREIEADPRFQNPHLKSQLLHYRALSMALSPAQTQKQSADKTELGQTIRTALRTRIEAGGFSSFHLTRCIVGAALSIAGQTRSAELIFDKCLRGFDRASIYHAPTIYSYRAAMRLKQGRADEAEDDLRRMLSSMKELGNRHFFGWSPEVMSQLLSLAVREGIEADFARTLAREQMDRAVLDDGTMIPLLHVSTVGGVQLRLGDVSMGESGLTPTWQQVLMCIATHPDHSPNVEDVQLQLWPDLLPDESRTKFDTMLSRLRKKMAETFGKNTVGQYFQVKGKRVHLFHCVTDCDRILAAANEGLQFAEKRLMWRAHAAFERMLHHLGPNFGTTSADCSVPEFLTVPALKAFSTWSELLKTGNEPDRALDVIAKVLHLDGLNGPLHKKQYDLLVELNRPVEAAQALKEYRKGLEAAGFGELEINQIVDDLLAE